MSNRKTGPTAAILRLARCSPGGLIRWREALALYLRHSEAARRWERLGQTYHHMALSQLLRRHFVRVEGVDGHYVLRETIPERETIEDQSALLVHRFAFGWDEFGMSANPASAPFLYEDCV